MICLLLKISLKENAYDAANAEEIAERAHLQRSRNMARYATKTGNDTEEEE